MRRGRTSKARTSEPSGQRSGSRDFPPAKILSGTFWHQGSPARALSDVADPALTFGRYHRIGGRGVWYASSSETGAWAELFRHHEPGGVSPFEVKRRVGRVRVHGLHVLDLTQADNVAALDITPAELTGDDLSQCQLVAKRVLAAGYDGVLAPSAALDGNKTLAVFAPAVAKIVVETSRVRVAPARMRKLTANIRPKMRSR